jgi:glutamate carboxypeptidase
MKRWIAGVLVCAAVAGGARAELSPEEDELREWLAERQPAMVELLRGWVEANTGSTHTAGLERFAALLPAELAPLGFAVEIHPGARVELAPGRSVATGPLLVARRPAPAPGARRILLAGHYDTVFEPDSPFRGFEVEANGVGRARGPGVADMKGGMVVLLFALRALAESGDLDRGDWTVVLNADEEIGSLASRELLEREARRAELGFVFESAQDGGAMVRSRRGVGQFVLTVRGVAAHAGNAHASGRSAIHALARKIVAIEALTDYARGVTVNVGVVRGGSKRNIVPDAAEAEIDVRFDSPEEGERVRAELARIAAEPDLEGTQAALHGALHRPPKPETEATRRLLDAHAAVARDLGLAPREPVHSGGGTDGSLLSAVGLPVLDSMGVAGGGAHTEREFVELDSLRERAAIAAILLRRLARAPEPKVE